MKFLRQGTATIVIVGPIVDKTTALPLMGLTNQSANGRLVKNGAGSALTVTSWTHDAHGAYGVGLSAAHTDTLGRCRVAFSDPATYLPVWEEFSILSAVVYDSLFGTAPLSTHTAAAVADAVWDEPRTDHTGAGTFGLYLDAAISGVSTGGVSVEDIAAAVMASPIEGTITLLASIRGQNAALLGKASGLGTTTPRFRDLGDTRDRIVATTDKYGNRSAVTLDLS